MARPTTPHDGFLIPNATDVADPILAEPDKIDFNTLANARWGVIEGCAVNESGATGVQISSGTALVNGQLVSIATSTTLSLTTPGTNSQFNLVVVDSGGVVRIKQGTALLDPVFPEPAANETVLASVYCAQGETDFRSNIIDKRKLLQTSLLTKIAPTAELVRNTNGSSNHFLVTGDGKMTWETDTRLYRSAAATLRVENNLVVNTQITTGSVSASGTVVAVGTIQGRNFNRGTVLPPSATGNGDLFVNSVTGQIYVWRSTKWLELVVADPGDTSSSAIPTGTVITSLETPVKMEPLGWIPLDGVKVITEVVYPKLFEVAALAAYMTGTAPTRSMTMPNLNKRVIMVDFLNAGKRLGAWTNNDVVLTKPNMPAHDHSIGGPTGTTSWVEAHDHTVKVTAVSESGQHSHVVEGGYHDHDITDPKHYHSGANQNGAAATFIAVDDDGQNKLDALFNDRSHTFSVTPRWNTMPAATGITVKPSTEHSHKISGGEHWHPVSLNGNGEHEHKIPFNVEGQARPFSITPEHFTVFAYIRS